MILIRLLIFFIPLEGLGKLTVYNKGFGSSQVVFAQLNNNVESFVALARSFPKLDRPTLQMGQSPGCYIQLKMKPLNIIVFLLVTFSSCGQTEKSDKEHNSTQFTKREALPIYQNMTSEICNCTWTTMRSDKPSTTFDSCYKAIVAKFTDTLKALGYDPSSSLGNLKLGNEIRLYRCKDLYSLMQKEWADEDAKKLLFKGTIVSQKQLLNGEIEIVMADSKTNEKRTFKSKSFLSDPTKSNKNTLEYEMTVEYEIRQNLKTNHAEYYIKENGKNMTIEVQKVGN